MYIYICIYICTYIYVYDMCVYIYIYINYCQFTIYVYIYIYVGTYICTYIYIYKLVSVQLLSHVWLFETPWAAACQTSLSITNSWNLFKLMSIELVMPSNHLILYCPLLLLLSILPSIRVFSNESALCIRWPKYWSFSFSISPFNEYARLISFRMDWLNSL